MYIVNKWTIKAGLILILSNLALSGIAGATEKHTLSRVNNPYVNTLLKYQEKLRAGQTSDTSSKDLTLSPYVVGGSNATAGAFPWMVALLRADTPNALDAQFCGGTLVLPDVVVTAAHCLDSIPNADAFEVVVGAYNLNTVTVNQRLKVHGFIVHPQFDSNIVNNDIGIVKLESPVTNQTLPIISSQQFAALQPGDALTVIGFGLTNDPDFPVAGYPLTHPNILQQAQLGYVDHAVCNSNIVSLTNGALSLTNTQICAGTLGQVQDSCYGDSGGPLMANINGQWYLTGIVSWGLRCGYTQSYGVYTEAALYGQWTNDNAYGLQIPGNIDFDLQGIGETTLRSVVADNWGPNSISITSHSIQDVNSSYSIVATNCDNAILASKQTCDLDVAFNPSRTGVLSATVSVTSSAGSASNEIFGVGLSALSANSPLDTSGLNWYSGPNVKWGNVVRSDAINGSAMKSGAIGDSQYTALITNLNGPATVNFDWTVSSELNYDFLVLAVDGEILDGISGNIAWSSKTYDIITPGNHVVEWVYFKDQSDPVPTADYGLVDNITWGPLGTPANLVQHNGNGAGGGNTGGSPIFGNADIKPSSDDGGGAMGYLLIPLLLLGIRRRYRSQIR